jgi:cytochrome c
MPSCSAAWRTLSLDRQGLAKPAQDRAPFRTPHKGYPIETVGEALAEGIATGHPAMPAFQLDPDQIGDLLAYLKTLE